MHHIDELQFYVYNDAMGRLVTVYNNTKQEPRTNSVSFVKLQNPKELQMSYFLTDCGAFPDRSTCQYFLAAWRKYKCTT